MIAMQNLPFFRKFLLLVVIASMLSLHLASIVRDSSVSTYDNAIVAISALVNDNGSTEDCLLKTESELSFNVDLVPTEGVRFPGDRLQAAAKPVLADLNLKEHLSEIFIPPKIVS